MFNPRIFLIGTLLALTSCGASGTQSQPATAGKPAPTPRASASASKAPTKSSNQMIAPPPGAQYTIYCAQIKEEMHVELANRLKIQLLSTTGMKDWYVIHEPARSVLYYGYYRAVADPKEPKETARAVADRKKIEAIQSETGGRPFSKSAFVELIAPDPEAPPEWNLVNATGAYTLQIGVYKGGTTRKEAAVEAVREARKQGIEAYYYHGEQLSLVCVGTWPASAIKREDSVSSARGSDPSQTLFVVPQTADPELNKAFDETARQSNLQLIRPKSQIVDPTLLEAMKRFPTNDVNGFSTKRIVDGKEVFEPSLPVPIPKDPAKIEQADPRNSRQPGVYDPGYRPPIPRQTDAPPSAQQPGSGRLRGLGG